MCNKHTVTEEVIKATDSEPTFEDINYQNEVLDSSAYKKFKKETENVLSEQRQELVYAGVIVLVYREFFDLFRIAKEEKKPISQKQLDSIEQIITDRAYRRMG